MFYQIFFVFLHYRTTFTNILTFKIKKTMERITITDLEKMTNSKYVCTQKLKLDDAIFGDKRKRVMEFDIFDGFAYCADYDGKEYFMHFPKLSFIKMAKDMEKSIRDYMSLTDTEPIKVTDVLVSYNTLYVNA